MEAGTLDERITFQVPRRDVPDGMGGDIESWQDHVTVWASIRSLRGRERMLADTINADSRYRIAIRNRRDITEDMRIVWRGRAMNITVILDDGPRAMHLVIEADKGVAT